MKNETVANEDRTDRQRWMPCPCKKNQTVIRVQPVRSVPHRANYNELAEIIVVAGVRGEEDGLGVFENKSNDGKQH